MQIYTEILFNLASNGPMNLTKLCKKVDLKKIESKRHLKLLMNSGLVEKENFGKNKIFYTVTEKGLTFFKIFSLIIEDTQKIQLREFEAITTELLETGYY